MAAAALASQHAPAAHKWLVAIAVMLGTTLEVLDTSIINVALPHMQGTFSASVDEIAWVLTSYLVANGVMIPMTGWISSRFGRKRYFLLSVFVFVAASALCGAARFARSDGRVRLLQGAAGAAMIPSSQAILMETFPPDEQQMAHGGVGNGPDGRADPRADPGRLDYRQLELAVEFLHQPSARRDRLFDGLGVRP